MNQIQLFNLLGKKSELLSIIKIDLVWFFLLMVNDDQLGECPLSIDYLLKHIVKSTVGLIKLTNYEQHWEYFL